MREEYDGEWILEGLWGSLASGVLGKQNSPSRILLNLVETALNLGFGGTNSGV